MHFCLHTCARMFLTFFSWQLRASIVNREFLSTSQGQGYGKGCVYSTAAFNILSSAV